MQPDTAPGRAHQQALDAAGMAALLCRRPNSVTTAKGGSKHHVPGLNLMLAFNSACWVDEELAWLDDTPALSVWEK